MSKKSKKEKEKNQEKSLKSEIVGQMLNLATSGFGLVAALAWNEAIQGFVRDYIKDLFPNSYGLISQFVYAVIITVFAVTITYQLSKLSAKLQKEKKE